jgi:hypothetical protein
MLRDEFLDCLKIDRKDDDVRLLQRVFDRHRLGSAVELGREFLRFRRISFRDDDVLAAGRQVLRKPRTDISKADNCSFHGAALLSSWLKKDLVHPPGAFVGEKL